MPRIYPVMAGQIWGGDNGACLRPSAMKPTRSFLDHFRSSLAR